MLRHLEVHTVLIQFSLECRIVDVPFDDEVPRFLIDGAVRADLRIRRTLVEIADIWMVILT